MILVNKKQFEDRGAINALFLIGGDWLTIASCIGISNYFANSPIIYFFSALIIASRQHGLFAVVHEGAHQNLSQSKKWNDFLSNAFAAWPLGLSTTRYRVHHWKHHNHTNTDLDPDWARKIHHPKWRFPRSKRSFLFLYVPYLFGAGIIEWGFTLKLVGIKGRELLLASPFLLLSLSSIVYLNWQKQFFLYWVFPLFFLVPFMSRMRSIAEHLGTPNENEFNGSRNIATSPWEAYFFGPHNTCYHLVHHLYPHAPWHAIPQIHRELMNKPEYLAQAHECDGYFFGKKSAFSELTKLENAIKSNGSTLDAKRNAA